jgi:hypothetical protein
MTPWAWISGESLESECMRCPVQGKDYTGGIVGENIFLFDER